MDVDIHTLAGAYALDAVDDLERTRFSRHLAECESCSFEVAELRETATRLGELAEEAPPARLRAAVLGEIASTRQVSPAPMHARAAASTTRWRRWTAAAVAAGVIAVGAGAATWAVQDGRLRHERARADAIADVVAQPDAQVRGVDMPGGGRMTAVVSPGRGQGVAFMTGLAAPPKGKAYQLWLIGDQITSAGVLDAGQRDGNVLLANIGAARELGVTVERAGGVDQPSTNPIAHVPLA